MLGSFQCRFAHLTTVGQGPAVLQRESNGGYLGLSYMAGNRAAIICIGSIVVVPVFI